MTFANADVSPAFPSPYTTTYIPREKNTISHGAPLIALFVFTVELCLPIRMKIIAMVPAIIDTGTLINSLVKYPITNKPRTYHDRRNILWSLMASLGSLSLETSYDFGIFFLK